MLSVLDNRRDGMVPCDERNNRLVQRLEYDLHGITQI